MDNKNMFLFWASGSAPCWKAMLTLAEKGLWEGLPNKLCQFSAKDHKSEEVMKLNPRGQMPTFRDGEVVVNESNAISLYIEEKYSKDSNRLFPNDPEAKAQVYQRMFESANIQAKIIQPIVYYRWQTKKEDWNKDPQFKEKLDAAAGELKIWNSYLDGAEYLVGGKFSMADVFFFPFLALLVRLGVKFQSNTNLQKYYDNMCKRPNIQATWPPHWKDSPSPGTLDDVAA